MSITIIELIPAAFIVGGFLRAGLHTLAIAKQQKAIAVKRSLDTQQKKFSVARPLVK